MFIYTGMRDPCQPVAVATRLLVFGLVVAVVLAVVLICRTIVNTHKMPRTHVDNKTETTRPSGRSRHPLAGPRRPRRGDQK